MQNRVGAIGQDLDCLRLDSLRVVEKDFPAACVCEVGKYLPVHDGVGAGLVRRAKLNGYVVGKVRRPCWGVGKDRVTSRNPIANASLRV
jgi:hypothetical protein